MALFNKFESGDDLIRKSHVKNLVKMASADGHVDGEEMAFLQKIAKRYGVDQEEVDFIIANPNHYSFTPPANKTDRNEQFINLCRMVLADGIIDSNELNFAEKFAIGLGFSMDKVSIYVNKTLDAIKAGEDDDALMDMLDSL